MFAVLSMNELARIVFEMYCICTIIVKARLTNLLRGIMNILELNNYFNFDWGNFFPNRIQLNYARSYQTEIAEAFRSVFVDDDFTKLDKLLDDTILTPQLAFYVNQTLLTNRWKRVKRLRIRAEQMILSNHAVFVTLTFRDDVFETTSVETRRRYVARFLKQSCDTYVANIDFGEKNGREHYHAIVDSKINPLEWKYGSCNVERIRPCKNDSVAVSKYLTKLTSHAIKESTGHAYRLIYSKS